MKSDYHTYAQGRYDSRTSFTETGFGGKSEIWVIIKNTKCGLDILNSLCEMAPRRGLNLISQIVMSIIFLLPH